MIDKTCGYIVLGLLVLFFILCISACGIEYKGTVSIDNVTMEIPIDSETCPGIYTTAGMCYMSGEAPPEEFMQILGGINE